MIIVIPDTWLLFCFTFGIVQLTSLIMGIQGRKFYTHDGVTRKFSIMDLEFAANGKEIRNIIQGIFSLPKEQAAKVVKALKGQLFVDFLFMPAAYGSIFLLCMNTSAKLTTEVGAYFFAFLAWAQLLPWICDILENIFLLRSISQKSPQISDKTFQAYKINEWLKWGIALMSAVCALATMFYFWLTGNYMPYSLVYLLIIIAEVVVFALLGKRLRK